VTTRDRERVLELVGYHGWNATAFQTLETGYSYFFHGGEAAVAYVDTGQAWVAAGAPICADELLAKAGSAFAAAAREAGRRCCFFATEERLRQAAGDSLRSLCIGEQPVWDPREWPAILERAASLREQLRRARAKGVEVRALSASELESQGVRERLARVTQRWHGRRALAPMGFLVQVEPFTFPAYRRSFVAERRGEIVGFAALIPVPARNGWFLEDLVRDPRAPNGTNECLVDAAMRSALADGASWFTLGLAPLAGEVHGALRFARAATRLLYDFEGLALFKAKLRPQGWTPIYLSFPPSQGTLVSIGDALVAFTGGGVLRFGWRSLTRR